MVDDINLEYQKESFWNKLKKDKLNLFFIILIITLGIFLRLNDYGEVSYWGDDVSTVPTGLLWFYPHTMYPGLSGVGEPALGNFFIGLGCMLSGEDFSGVSQIRPMFYPGREALIGKALVKAEPYCFSSMYFFGLLFFIAVSIFALITLPKYSSLYVISFFAFWPEILVRSRWMHVDIILFFFVVSALLFLWLAYKANKTEKKESLFFIISFVFFALAFSTKLPAVAYLVFALFLILEKYKDETIFLLKNICEKIGLNSLIKSINKDKLNVQSLIKILIYSSLTYLVILFITFEFNLKNIFTIIKTYNSHASNINAFGLNPEFYRGFVDFLKSINILDMIIFIFAFYILIKILFKKNKTNFEKFILYLTLYLILICSLFQIAMMLRVFFTFAIGFIFLASLIFSDKDYSIFSILKIKNLKVFFYMFISVYIIFSFVLALNSSPYFQPKNFISCYLQGKECSNTPYNAKEIANLLSSVLNENETFISESDIIYYYTRQEESLQAYIFISSFQQQIGRMPRTEDYIKYYHPFNRTVRYVAVKVDDYESYEKDAGILLKKYKPMKILKIKSKDAVYLYDLFNLEEKTIDY
jgi:hypothetical protein